MMQETEIKRLLEETFARLMPGETMEKGRKKYAKLHIQRAEQQVPCEKNLYQKAKETLTEKIKVLEEKANDRLLLMTGSGLSGNNPTVVELIFTEDTVTLTAWAKEGFIPQRSARKAVETIRAQLGL